MRTRFMIAALAAALLVWAGVSAQQGTRPTPGPGTGIVTVTGSVDIGNTLDVRAAQRGDWRVAVANTPDVRVANTPSVVVAPPGFVKKGLYEITWPSGDRETVTIVEVGPGGWVQVTKASRDGRRRWVNLSAARDVEGPTQE
jgi:hypothetical protein